MSLPIGVDARFTGFQGVYGNLVVIALVYAEGAPDLTIVVTNGTYITLNLGLTGGVQNLSWDAIATAFNADSTASKLAFSEGRSSDTSIPLHSAQGDPLKDGSQGLGLGQFYAAATAPPPINTATADCALTINSVSPPLPGDAVGCFELLRVTATMRPARHLPVRGSAT